MKDKLSIFNKSQLYDRASVAGLWLFVLLLIVLPQESKVISLFGLLICYFLVHAGCTIHNLLPFLSRRLESVEKVYEGNFDQLVKEMYEAGLELQSKIGERYIFGTKYLILDDEKYLVEDLGNSCTVRGTRRCMYFLEKHLSLREKFNRQNVDCRNKAIKIEGR